MTWKLPNNLTIQKPNYRHFSVRGFAVLKRDPFDGKNFLIWKAKMELWLTAMSCYHAAEGSPANLSPENEAKFKADDNLFRGIVISALDTSSRKAISFSLQGKSCGMHLLESLELLMLTASYISWSSCMTTRWLRTDLWWNRLMSFSH